MGGSTHETWKPPLSTYARFWSRILTEQAGTAIGPEYAAMSDKKFEESRLYKREHGTDEETLHELSLARKTLLRNDEVQEILHDVALMAKAEKKSKKTAGSPK